MITIIKISCLIIATIIGAGFSSGREIFTFFNMCNSNIILVLITTFLTFYITIIYTLKLSYNKKITDYNEMVNFIFNRKIKKIIHFIFKIFLLIIFSIMIAGFGEFLYMTLGISRFLGSIFLLVICFITLVNNIEGIIKVSVLIVPIIIFSIICLYISELNNNLLVINNSIRDTKYFSGIIYASYNLVIAIPVIISSSKLINNYKQINNIGIISSGILVILILIIYLLLDKYIFLIKDNAMPLLYISKEQSRVMYIMYKCVIAISIYTTAVSTQYSIVQKYKDKKYILSILFSGIISLIISSISFNRLIDICFPIIGIVGIVQTICLIYYSNKSRNI